METRHGAAPMASHNLKRLCTTFAVIGALVLLYQLIGYIRWAIGPSFAEVPPGPSPITDEVLANVRNSESFMAMGGIVWTLFLIGFSWFRRELVWPVFVTILWSSVYWQESMTNAANQAFTLNLHFFNRGDWISDLPFMPVDRATITQPLIQETMAFYWLNPVFSLLAAGIMILCYRYLKIGNIVALCAIAVLSGVLMDIYAEFSGISQGIMAWNRAWPPLTVYAGTVRQWPIYEGLLLGALWALPGIFYFLRGANRFTPWDHGFGHIRAASYRNAAIVLMQVGLLNTLFMAYNLIVVWFSAMSPEVAGFPSYLGGGIK